jgi:5-methylthioadenosine/S-adenosylhomocysteine deaminase
MRTRITGGMVIGFNGEKHVVLDNSEVVFEGNKIIFVGKSYGERVDQTIDARSKLVLPGFIDIHTHSLSAPLMHRGILEDEGETLYRYLLPVRYGTTSRGPYAVGKDAYVLSRLTLLEVLKSGVTTILEQTDNLEDVLQIAQTLGLRVYGCLSYYSGMPFEEHGKIVYPDFSGSSPGFDENLRLIKGYRDTCNGRIKVWLGPHAPDTCSVDLLRQTREKANELNVGIGTHVAQSLTEVNEIRGRFQKTPVEFLDGIGFWGEDVVAAHAIYTTTSDMQIMARSKMTVAHCASTYLDDGLRVPMATYRKHGINVVIGTDQNAMDIIGEMRLAMFSSKCNEQDPHATSCLDVFNAVTLSASRALGRDDIGRISPGAKADIILVNLRQPHLSPFKDPLKILLYHANRNDVDTVIVDGQVLMAGRKVSTIDEEEAISEADAVTERIWRKAESEIGLPQFLMRRSCHSTL